MSQTKSTLMNMVIAESIRWQLSERGKLENSNLETPINTSLFINLTSLLENIITKIIIFKIGRDYLENELGKKLQKRFIVELQNEGWDKYLKKIEFLFDDKMNSLVGDEVNKSMRILFQIRNQIVHGNDTTLKFTNISDVEVQGKHKSIFGYLASKNLIEDKQDSSAIIRNNVFDYFLNESKIFVRNICNHFEDIDKEFIHNTFASCLFRINQLNE